MAARAASPVLHWLDASACADHVLLESTDHCAYLADYEPGPEALKAGFSQMMWHFKCRPSLARGDPRLALRKERALRIMAGWLRQALGRETVESWTWVPIPPSRHRDDPDFDDRLTRTLALAFEGYDLDQRAMLLQASSTAADHRSRRRLPEGSLHELLQLDAVSIQAGPLRGGIALFDDVLASGKHFRCCVRRLRERFPYMPIHGIFLMRRLPGRRPRALGQAW